MHVSPPAKGSKWINHHAGIGLTATHGERGGVTQQAMQTQTVHLFVKRSERKLVEAFDTNLSMKSELLQTQREKARGTFVTANLQLHNLSTSEGQHALRACTQV